MALSNRRVDRTVRRQRWIKLCSYFVIIHLVLGCAVLGRPWLLGLFALVLVIGAWELRGAQLRALANHQNLGWKIWPIYLTLTMGVLFSIWSLPTERIVFLYLIVAAFDGFSQLMGQAIGHRRLAPELSPGKTVEGLLGGIVGALVVAASFQSIGNLTVGLALLTGAAAAFAGLGGDLSASWVKRRANIKDFSAMIPGHGGVLDRFDSFIGASALLGPAFYSCPGPWR